MRKLILVGCLGGVWLLLTACSEDLSKPASGTSGAQTVQGDLLETTSTQMVSKATPQATIRQGMPSPAPVAVLATTGSEVASATAGRDGQSSAAAVASASSGIAARGTAAAASTSGAASTLTAASIAKIPSATPVAAIAAIAARTPIAAQTAIAPKETPGVAATAAGTSGANYKPITFATLASYKYKEPVPAEGADGAAAAATANPSSQIPPEILALNGTRASVEGYMVPMEVDDDGGVRSFIIAKTQPQCCFGDAQAMNEWVEVKMISGKRAEFNTDRPIKASGSLEVGEKKQDGFVMSVYRMTADKVTAPD